LAEQLFIVGGWSTLESLEYPLYSLDAYGIAPNPVATTKNTNRYCHMSCRRGSRNCPRLRTISINEDKLIF
jgi:hypothetical protein